MGPKLPIAKELPLDANAADPPVSFIILNTSLFGSSSAFFLQMGVAGWGLCKMPISSSEKIDHSTGLWFSAFC